MKPAKGFDKCSSARATRYKVVEAVKLVEQELSSV